LPKLKTARAANENSVVKPTREMLLDVAGELLAEVGIERISTNMICKRAGVTPPTLYHYFAHKYAVVEALGMRLMARQNLALVEWIARHAGDSLEAFADGIEDLMRETARITDEEPGGVWIERALHATPKLEHIRIQSHRYVTDRLTDAFAPLAPHLDRDQVWRRVRMTVEFGYVTEELLHTETDVPRDAIFADASRILRLALLGSESNSELTRKPI
jgi:AcrR family transcriptional regulator